MPTAAANPVQLVPVSVWRPSFTTKGRICAWFSSDFYETRALQWSWIDLRSVLGPVSRSAACKRHGNSVQRFADTQTSEARCRSTVNLESAGDVDVSRGAPADASVRARPIRALNPRAYPARGGLDDRGPGRLHGAVGVERAEGGQTCAWGDYLNGRRDLPDVLSLRVDRHGSRGRGGVSH